MTDSPKSGRTAWDLLADLFSRRSFLLWITVGSVAIVLAAGASVYFGLVHLAFGKASVVSGGDSSPSPFMHWWGTFYPGTLNQCGSWAEAAFKATRAKRIEEPDKDSRTFGRVADYGNVTAQIVCARSETTTFALVTVSALDSSDANDLSKHLRDFMSNAKVQPNE